MPLEHASRQDLVDECQGLVHALARRIHRQLPKQIDLDDLIGYGQIGVAEAARDFDPTRGGRFSTFAYYRIRGAIFDGLSKLTWHKRSHYRRLRFEQMANEVLRHNQEELPAGGEGESLERGVRWLGDVSSSLAIVYITTHAGLSDDRDIQLQDERAESPSELAEADETHRKINELIDALPDDQRQLIRATYFEGATLQEAGEKLGISKSWASRLHAKILRQLADSLRILGLEAQ